MAQGNGALNKAFWGRVKALGIERPEQLLLYVPTHYMDYRVTDRSLADGLSDRRRLYLRLRVKTTPREFEPPPGSPRRVQLMLTDGVRSAEAVIFGAIHPWNTFRPGDYIHVTTEIEHGWGGNLRLKNPKLVAAHEQGHIVPVYQGKEGRVSPAIMADRIQVALRELLAPTIVYLCQEVGLAERDLIERARLPFADLRGFFRALHRPRSPEEAEAASAGVRRINALQSVLAATGHQRQPNEQSRIKYTVGDIRDVVARLPFELTDDQRRAIWQITRDLESEFPMDRVLTGDVGSGKTLGYAIPAYLAYKAGKNVVIISPNSLLARQIAAEIREVFDDVDVELMIGGNSRETPLNRHAMVIGTSAIGYWLERINHSHRIDYLVIDEQQKFGSVQREILVQPHTNVLESTATPIPRTGALVRYGNKAVSVIRQCPVKKTIHTKLVGRDARGQVFRHMERLVEEGGQVALLYPQRTNNRSLHQLAVSRNAADREAILALLRDARIDDYHAISSEDKVALPGVTLASHHVVQMALTDAGLERLRAKLDQSGLARADVALIEGGEASVSRVRDVYEAYEKLSRHHPGRVALIHGGLSNDEKRAAIERVQRGEADYIVTTSVIEIGLTMPSLKGLCIIEAENYGVSTLHQIRGRLARKGGEGFCYLMTSRPLAQMPEDTVNRLRIVERNTDGFRIAELDINERGFGNLALGAMEQHGKLAGVFPQVKVTPSEVESLLQGPWTMTAEAGESGKPSPDLAVTG